MKGMLMEPIIGKRKYRLPINRLCIFCLKLIIATFAFLVFNEITLHFIAAQTHSKIEWETELFSLRAHVLLTEVNRLEQQFFIEVEKSLELYCGEENDPQKLKKCKDSLRKKVIRLARGQIADNFVDKLKKSDIENAGFTRNQIRSYVTGIFPEEPIVRCKWDTLEERICKCEILSSIGKVRVDNALKKELRRRVALTRPQLEERTPSPTPTPTATPIPTPTPISIPTPIPTFTATPMPIPPIPPPTIRLEIDPNVRTLQPGFDPKEISIIAGTDDTQNVRFAWNLDGPGKLIGDTASPGVLYLLPDRIDKRSAQATITVTVSNDRGKQATARVTFTLLRAPTPLTATPIPTPTLTPTPTPSPIDAILPTGSIKRIKKSYTLGEEIHYTLKASDNKSLQKITFIVQNSNSSVKEKQSWRVGGQSALQKSSFSTKDWKSGTYHYVFVVEDVQNNSQKYRGNFALVEKTECSVKYAQKILKQLFLYRGEIDGTLNDDTVNALQNFQLLHGLEDTGYIDKETCATLMKEEE